ncbi:hypothetical protein [Paenibacillus sp. GCM10027626]
MIWFSKAGQPPISTQFVEIGGFFYAARSGMGVQLDFMQVNKPGKTILAI